jgi:DNA-binding FadR family transcriptional regulator
MQPADIDYLQSLVAKMADLGGAEADWLVAADLDLAFHRRIVACSQNRSLIQSYGAMDVKINALFITVKQYLPARFFKIPERHQKLVDVFRAGEWWRAEPVVADHWFETAAKFKQLLAGPPAESNGASTHGCASAVLHRYRHARPALPYARDLSHRGDARRA